MTHNGLLVIIRDGEIEQEIPLRPGSFQFGRSDDNDICLADIGVSRRHARIVVSDMGEVMLEDLGSGNGTWFHGERIDSHLVMHGEEFSIEPFLLRFDLPTVNDLGTLEFTDGDEFTATDAGEDHTVALEAPPPLEPDPVLPGRLYKIKGPGPNREYSVNETGLTLGRSDKRDVVLMDPAASRLHAEIISRGDLYWLRDAGSANGVYLNGRRIQEKPLSDGDTIRIGETEFKFTFFQQDSGYRTDVLGSNPEHTESFAGVVAPGEEQPAGGWPSPPPGPTHYEQIRSPTGGFGAFPQAPPQPAPPQPAQPAQAPGPAPFRPPSGFPGQPAGGFGAFPQAPAATPPSAFPQAPAPTPQAPAATPPSAFPLVAPAGADPHATEAFPISGTGFPAPAAPQPAAAPRSNDFKAAAHELAGGPALGKKPGESGFGGLEMEIDPKKARSGGSLPGQGGFFSKRINQVSVGILAVVFLMVLAKKAPEMSSGGAAAPAVSDAPVDTDPITAAQVIRLKDEGMTFFQSGKYYDAAGKFLNVLQIAPGDEAAERMGYLSCEFIAIKTMQEHLGEKVGDMQDKMEIKAQALEAAAAARYGREITDAMALVERALTVNPGDPELTTAAEELETKRRRAGVAAVQRAQNELSEEVKTIFEQGERELNGKNYIAAVKQFNKVLETDPDRSTEYYYNAEEGIRKAKKYMDVDSRASYEAGLAALKSNDFMTARTKLQETLRINPYNAGAKTKLQEAQAQLEQMALSEYQSGRVMEQANQIERALQKYNSAIALVGDRSHSIHKNAQARISELLE